ncbi:MAG: transposase zinc-binding domain-containing protein, partial [bacterium]
IIIEYIVHLVLRRCTTIMKKNYNGQMDSNISGVYHPRNPEQSPLWQILNTYYESFEAHYEQKFVKKYGFWRSVIKEVVEEYLRCGDLKEGFARVRCPDCGHSYILAFSCKSRWFCPTCHMKLYRQIKITI